MDLHFADQTLTLIAGVSFILCYILGLFLGRFHNRVGSALLLTFVGVVMRGFAPPLTFHAIFAVSAVHLGIGVLSAQILRKVRPLGYKPESATKS